MKKIAGIAIPFFFLIFILSCNPKKTDDSAVEKVSSQQVEVNEQWTVLFDGTGTWHWRGAHMSSFPSKGWDIVDGELVNDGSGSGNLVSRSEYSNFILEWEWRLFDEGGNTGLKYFVKETDDEKGKRALGLEYQMLDDMRHSWMKEGKMKPNDYHTTGGLYELFPPSADKKMAPLGEFNKSRIVADGNHLEHWLNGVKVMECERGSEEFLAAKAKSKFKELPEFGLHEQGHLLLQDHQSKVGFKNIRIQIINTKDS